jgi:hypothetical protein
MHTIYVFAFFIDIVLTSGSNILPEVFCAITSTINDVTLADKLWALSGESILFPPKYASTTVILKSTRNKEK